MKQRPRHENEELSLNQLPTDLQRVLGSTHILMFRSIAVAFGWLEDLKSYR